MQAQARKEKLERKEEKTEEEEELIILRSFDEVKDAVEKAINGGRNLFYYDAKPHKSMAILGSPIANFKIKDVDPNEVIKWLREIANEEKSDDLFGMYGFWVLKEKKEFNSIDDVLKYLSDLGYILDEGVYWVADQIRRWFDRPPFTLEWLVSITYTPYNGHLYVEDEFRVHWQPPPEE